MNADGSEQTQLTNNLADDASPFWSPDGKRIAFISARNKGYHQIYVMNADGSQQTGLTNNEWESLHPAWSGDSKYSQRQKVEGRRQKGYY
jgi:Tol biopolymer transport system component